MTNLSILVSFILIVQILEVHSDRVLKSLTIKSLNDDVVEITHLKYNQEALNISFEVKKPLNNVMVNLSSL